MSKETIKHLCKKNQLYVTPKLNDVLYLHYQGAEAVYIHILWHGRSQHESC